jgi:ligand-binding sensor domain-containing protein
VSRLREDGTWTTFTTADGLAGDAISAIAMGLDSSMWFGVAEQYLDPSMARGVSRLGPDGMWTTYTSAEGLADNFVKAIAAGPDGSMWFITLGGVSRYMPAQ